MKRYATLLCLVCCAGLPAPTYAQQNPGAYWEYSVSAGPVLAGQAWRHDATSDPLLRWPRWSLQWPIELSWIGRRGWMAGLVLQFSQRASTVTADFAARIERDFPGWLPVRQRVEAFEAELHGAPSEETSMVTAIAIGRRFALGGRRTWQVRLLAGGMSITVPDGGAVFKRPDSHEQLNVRWQASPTKMGKYEGFAGGLDAALSWPLGNRFAVLAGGKCMLTRLQLGFTGTTQNLLTGEITSQQISYAGWVPAAGVHAGLALRLGKGRP